MGRKNTTELHDEIFRRSVCLHDDYENACIPNGRVDAIWKELQQTHDNDKKICPPKNGSLPHD